MPSPCWGSPWTRAPWGSPQVGVGVEVGWELG